MVDKEEAKRKIQELVEKYKGLVNTDRYRTYTEAETKKDFIEPLFETLGWDVRNSEEVSAEERISKNRVDYGFKINGITKFFVEAKKLKADLDNTEYAQQAMNYSWHKGVVWAVLTDFEGIKIFNAEVKEPVFNCQFIEIPWNQYISRFDQLWLLSKPSMENNELDREAEKWGKKRKRVPIDRQLLNDFIIWRELLSKNILKNNRNLTPEQLDEVVQRIIDRMIFIRKCEDSRIEERKLWEIITDWQLRKSKKITTSLNKVFSEFNDKYDSKLFLPHLCENLEIDNEVLYETIRGLYCTKDRQILYDFSAIDADILGNIYEEYLGHILKKTEKRAKLEAKHAYRKAHGIYYTPTYIVDYIVRNTLGELLKDKKVDPEKIRVLDPACGSGSFLIKAFDVLNEHFKKKHGADSPFRRSKILNDNIFGVDLDPKAVEIAQLNLLLKTAEKRHKLPLLQKNIRCGNSLIDDPEVAGNRGFKWKEEFNDIMKEGGFDVVIGNPPYVRQEELSEIKPYLHKNYEVYHGMADLFVYFFEQEMNMLKEGGYFGMIVSNKWLRAGYGVNLRKFISKFWIEKFIDFGDLKVFPDATIYPCIIILRKVKKPNPKIQVCKMETLSFDSLEGYVKKNQFSVNQNGLGEKEWNIQSAEANQLLNKIVSSGTELEKYSNSRIYRGILTGLNKAFVIDEKTKDELITKDKKSAEIIKPILSGSEIKRYAIFSKSKYLIFTRRGIEINKYSAIKKHLQKFEAELTPKTSLSQRIGRKPGDYKWYEIQDVIAYHREFEKPKIVWGNLVTKASFYFDEEGYYVNAPGCILPTNSKYILGILNSKLMSYFLKSICAERQGGFIEQKPVYVSKIPIKQIPESQQHPLINLADNMLYLHKRLNEIGDKKTDERTRIEEEIKKTNKEIDELVYKIYGITEEEKRIIEESLGV